MARDCLFNHHTFGEVEIENIQSAVGRCKEMRKDEN